MPRAGSVPISPVYQVTVLLDVPATSAVAVERASPATRIGGWPAPTLKKLSAAAIAEAADSDVAASFCVAVVSEACRFAAVALTLAPMVNSPAPGGEAFVAVSENCALVPSGSANENVIASPGFGLLVRLTLADAGDPAGPVTVAPLSELTLASFMPNTVAGVSSAIVTCEPTAAGIESRPSPLAPRSA